MIIENDEERSLVKNVSWNFWNVLPCPCYKSHKYIFCRVTVRAYEMGNTAYKMPLE